MDIRTEISSSLVSELMVVTQILPVNSDASNQILQQHVPVPDGCFDLTGSGITVTLAPWPWTHPC